MLVAPSSTAMNATMPVLWSSIYTKILHFCKIYCYYHITILIGVFSNKQLAYFAKYKLLLILSVDCDVHWKYTNFVMNLNLFCNKNYASFLWYRHSLKVDTFVTSLLFAVALRFRCG
jgi:hypothetical protein